MPEPEVVESVEALPSEDNGNVPVGEIAPAAPGGEPTETPASPAEPVEPAAPAEPVVELFELPDGRKVDAATLATEWKENFMPEFTRKSQELAKVGKPSEPLPNNEPAKKPFEDPTWAPGSYAELIEIAKTELRGDLAREEQQAAERRAAIENQVVAALTEIKAADPTLNENALFTHAMKYGFQDLKAAHQNMKDMAAVVKKTTETTVKNIQKRNDPVSIAPGAGGGQGAPASSFGNAVEFLRSIKK